MWKLMGADPELFLSKNGKIVSAIGKIGGTKEHPIPVKELGNGFAFQEDNVLVEYNIPPAKSYQTFFENNEMMLSFLNDKVKRLDPEYKLLKKASGCISEEDAQNPLAHVFGCDPDFNVWTMKPNPRPFNPNPLFRTGGGHLHFAIKCSNAMAVRFTRGLDLYLGTWSVTVDKDKERRTLYGKAGAMRRKPYGLEYRVLSNFWVDNLSYIKTIWDLANHAWRATLSQRSVIDLFGKDSVEIINSSDATGANTLINKIQ